MACNKNLFESLGLDVAIGGSWSLESFTNSPAPTTLIVTYSSTGTDGNYVDLSIDLNTGIPADIPTSDHNLYINPDSMSPGTYVFRYTVTTGNCSDSSDITFVVVEGANSGFGGTNEILLCTNDQGELYLIDLLNGNDGTNQIADLSLTFTDTVNYNANVSVLVDGLISNPTGTITNYTLDGTTISTINVDSTINITNMLSETGLNDPANLNNGESTIEISYTSIRTDGGDPEIPIPGCDDNCVETTTILFRVTAPPNAGIDNTVTVCNLVS